MIDLFLLGSGGNLPLPERGLSSLCIKSSGKTMLIDCGEGTQISARQVGVNLVKLDYVFLTHLHYDHILGLPGLLSSLDNSDRERPLIIFGPGGTRHAVESMLCNGHLNNLKLRYHEYLGNEKFEFGMFNVDAFQVEHSVRCYGYAFNFPRACEFDLERAKERNVPQEVLGPLQLGYKVDVGGKVYDRNILFGKDRKGIKFLYSTDTKVCSSLVEFGKDSDLMFMEGMYPDKASATESGKNIHMTFEEAATVARDCNAGKLVLTHFGPTIANPEAHLRNAQRIFPSTVCGFRGYSERLMYDNVSNLRNGNENYPVVSLSSGILRHIANGEQRFFVTGEDYSIGNIVRLVSIDRSVKHFSILVRITGITGLDRGMKRQSDYVRLASIELVNRLQAQAV